MRLILLLLALAYNSLAFAVEPDDIFKTYHHPRFTKFQQITAPRLENFVNHQLQPFTHTTKAVFYPFGGPDIIYPLMVFPGAQSYLLIGLEPTGSLDPRVQIPKNLNHQLDSLLRRSFFITADMSQAIPSKQGILPLFLAQIALMKREVKDIKYQTLPFGKILEINFTHLQLEKKLFYIQTNIANQNLSEDLITFIKDNNLFDTCMIKASSYAFHQNIFSKLREFVLKNANIILQDDTGVPLNKFSEDFKLHLFGNYIKPYGKEWEGYFQKDLYRLYRETKPISEVAFCYGYGCGRTSPAIILATRMIKD